MHAERQKEGIGKTTRLSGFDPDSLKSLNILCFRLTISNMFGNLLVLFIVIPLVELFLLIQVGSRIGVVPTIGLIVLTGLIGASLARQQGLSAMRRIQEEIRNGRQPAGCC